MKDCTTCKYGFVDEQFGFPMCHHPLRFAKDCVDFNMHEEIEEPKKATGIEEKKLPEGLDEAAEKYSDKYCSDWAYRLEYEDAFIAGAKWQKEQMMKEAVEGFVATHLTSEGTKVTVNSGYLPKEMCIKPGDKVRIIIVKED